MVHLYDDIYGDDTRTSDLRLLQIFRLYSIKIKTFENKKYINCNFLDCFACIVRYFSIGMSNWPSFKCSIFVFVSISFDICFSLCYTSIFSKHQIASVDSNIFNRTQFKDGYNFHICHHILSPFLDMVEGLYILHKVDT